MTRILASPKTEFQFGIQTQSLAPKIHSHLTRLQNSPSSAALAAFEALSADAFSHSISIVGMAAFATASQQVGASPTPGQSHVLRKELLARGKTAASLMAQSSKVPLGLSAAVSKARVASKQRAQFATDYELRSAYFLGVQRGWELNKRSKKLWAVASSHDKDDICDDNADQGPISVYSFFDSGVMYPPGHFRCLCDMFLIL